MKREEVKELIGSLPVGIRRVADIIDKIYDDLDKKTCENCRWYQSQYNDKNCNSDTINVCKLFDIAFVKTFGCNKWEAK